MISIAIMAHPARSAAAEALAVETGGTIVWDEVGEEWHTGRRALAAFLPAATHHLVLQDDAVLVDGFLDQLAAAVSARPDSMLSLYAGTDARTWWQLHLAIATAQADEDSTAWMLWPRLMHGVAVVVPIRMIPPMLAWCDQLEMPYDERLSTWCLHNSFPVHYTWPSLVDHSDGPTLLEHRDGPRAVARRAWRTGTRSSWATADTLM